LEINDDELIIKSFASPTDGSNEYLIIDGDQAAVIDASNAYEDMKKILQERAVCLKYLLVTHGHKSDVNSLKMLKKNFGGTFCFHEKDLDLLRKKDKTIKVFHTPGHTMGALCFYVKKADALFSGNTLLKGKFGKIWGSNSMRLMIMSLRSLNSIIPPKTIVYTGRGPLTTIRDEAWMFCLNSQ
jgi:hydroxyacylglutathione hydrolase